MDYKDTLLMNKSNFEMRGNLNIKEPVLVKSWESFDLYEAMKNNRKEAKEFVLHDGPPYANGNMHCGHIKEDLPDRSGFFIVSQLAFGYKFFNLSLDIAVASGFRVVLVFFPEAFFFDLVHRVPLVHSG